MSFHDGGEPANHIDVVVTRVTIFRIIIGKSLSLVDASYVFASSENSSVQATDGLRQPPYCGVTCYI